MAVYFIENVYKYDIFSASYYMPYEQKKLLVITIEEDAVIVNNIASKSHCIF